ncbi:MAG: tetratricopeptide (TPR) repeat protein/DNA-binding transcriptional MerR regulator [Myxococcota bacterium]
MGRSSSSRRFSSEIMTIADLARRAGVWVETVALLEHRAMLPPRPDEHYVAHHLEVVRFITRIQGAHRLSLDSIGQALRDAAFDLVRAEEGLAPLLRPDPTIAGPGPASRGGLQQMTLAGDDLLDALAAAELVPASGPYGGHHVWTVQAAQELMATGLSHQQVLSVGEIARDIAATEVDAVMAAVGRGGWAMSTPAHSRERRLAVDRLLSAARFGGSRQQMARLVQASDRGQLLISEPLHVPSRLFMNRYRLDEALERRAARARQTSAAQIGGDNAWLEYGRLLTIVGRFEEAAAALQQAVVRPGLADPDTAHATLALALGALGQADAAAKHCALAASASRPHVHALRAVALTMTAASTSDVLVATARVTQALAALEESRRYPPADASEAVEARLARGRLCTVLPLELELGERGRADLRRVLEDTADSDDESLGLTIRGSRDLIRINALYFLGTALDDAGHRDEAVRLLGEVVSLDPVSAYGTRSWQRIHR